MGHKVKISNSGVYHGGQKINPSVFMVVLKLILDIIEKLRVFKQAIKGEATRP